MKHYWFLSFVVMLNGICVFNSNGSTLVKRFEHCDTNANYDAMFNVTFKTVHNKQYVDGTLTLKKPLDNTIRANVSVEMFNGSDYEYKFTINEKKTCDAMHKLMGEFVYEFERYAQLIPKMCPIPQGKYHAHNTLLDFKKLSTFPTFPLGNLRFISFLYDKDDKLFLCLLVEVENRL